MTGAGLRQILNALLAAAIAFIGGGAFYLLELPLPWTLGSITASAIAAFAGAKWVLPMPVRELARPVTGLMAGSAFTASVVASLAQWWPALVIVLVYTLITVFLGWFYFQRVAGWNRPTAIFSAAPGGMSELTMLGSTLGAEVRTLALAHATRVLILVFSVPFALQLIVGHPIGRVLPGSNALHTAWTDWLILAGCAAAGYGIGKITKLPGGIMLPTLLFSAIVHATGLSEASAPGWMVAGVQLIIGSTAGSRFNGVTLRELGATLMHSVAWASILAVLTACAAFLSSLFLDHPIIALALSFAPGGMAEMAIIAFTLQTEVAFVICCQVARILLIYLMVPVLFRASRGADPPPA